MSSSYRLSTFVLALSAAACAAESAPPLRAPTAPTTAVSLPAARPAPPKAEDPFRLAPPATTDGWEPTGDRGQSFTLANGLHVVVVERHAVPFVTARLSIALPLPAKDPAAAFRGVLANAVFLPASGTKGQLTGWCGVGECALLTRGAANELGEVLASEANVLERSDPPAAEAERRRVAAATTYAETMDAPRAARNSGLALLFGYDNPYSVPAALPAPIALEELLRWHRTTFVPDGATLVVVGDVAPDQVKAAATRAFGHWQRAQAGWRHGGARPVSVPPAVADGSRVLFAENPYVPVDYAALVVRGPAWNDPDLPALVVATEAYDAPLPRSAPCAEMDAHLSTSRRSVPIAFLPGVSAITLGGYFAPKTALGSIADVLRAIRASREADLGEEALVRAKSLAVAAWRAREADANTMAFTAGVAFGAGALDSAFGFEDRLAAVTAADVRRVAQRYFAEDALRLALIGKGPHFAGLQELGLGGAQVVDINMRPLGAPKK